MKINFFISLISLFALYEASSAELDNKKEERKLTYSDIINKDYVKYFRKY